MRKLRRSVVRIVTAIAVVAAMIPPSSIARENEFAIRRLNQFKTLDDFDSTSKFDAYVDGYVQECLDKSGGGTGAIACNIGDEIWDREVNRYYQKLWSALSSQNRESLERAEREWLRSRDESESFHMGLAEQRIPKEGSLYALLRAIEIHSARKEMNRQRTLQLKQWFELATQDFEAD